ncbi:MAG TPA: DUF1697 domain-containing protein [Gemmatimonadaceae bacterium]|nr:DUF1697 domain-containing protein [Gemmatimonadaceae bacterium]
MTTHIALLRAINVGGNSKVAMADLRALFTELGFADPRTLLQTGNVVFGGGRRSSATLERLLEQEMEQRLALRTDFFIRTAAEWERVIAGNPFPDAAKRDPGHLLVMFLKDAPGAERAEALRKAITGREIAGVDGRHAYLVYPDGVGRSRLTTALIERTLGTRGTGRNWNTVCKLAALVGA